MDLKSKLDFYEEILNSVTHFIGFILSIIALIILIKKGIQYNEISNCSSGFKRKNRDCIINNCLVDCFIWSNI